MSSKILRSDLISTFHSDVSFSPEGDLVIESESLPVEILTKIRKGKPVMILFVCPDEAQARPGNGRVPNLRGCRERDPNMTGCREVAPRERDPNMTGCREVAPRERDPNMRGCRDRDPNLRGCRETIE